MQRHYNFIDTVKVFNHLATISSDSIVLPNDIYHFLQICLQVRYQVWMPKQNKWTIDADGVANTKFKLQYRVPGSALGLI
jgi:hypothetical protein